MGSEPITSRRNPVVKEVRELHHAAGRQRQQRLLLEGTHLLQEALRLHRPPDLLLATQPWMERNEDLLRELPAPTTCRQSSVEVIEAASTTRHPDGVVCTIPWKLPGDPLPETAPDFGLLLDNVQDPGNLGTLLRTALAAGVDQIWLREGADPWQPKVLRASCGASLALSIGRYPAAQVLERLRAARRDGTAIAGTVVEGGEPFWSINWQRPILLMLGNEGSGLAQEWLAEADCLLRVPISHGVESLNVAVAAAPLLLERHRQKLGAGAPGADRGHGGGENAPDASPDSGERLLFPGHW